MSNSKMKLWLLRPVNVIKKNGSPWNPWYDKAFGFVVRAETEEQARVKAHECAGDENSGPWVPWLDDKYSTCLELTAEGPKEMIIRDFANG